MSTEYIAPESRVASRSGLVPLVKELADLAAEKRLYDLINALPTAIYTTDAEGRITSYNEAAVALWGVRPKLHSDRWCGSLRLYWPDGTALPHNECPMAIALKEQRAIDGQEAVAERPDGTRISFIAFPSPLHDATGKVVGAVNMLIDISQRKESEQVSQRLAAIIESSDDAIVAKDLNGIVMSWNAAAQRLFGYAPEEIIGKPISILIPSDRESEEPEILGRIRRGERIDHYETVRQRKDGTRIEISLTVSPVRSIDGKVVGVSKIARDISERKRAEERISLLAHEVQHRAKNLLALAQAAVHLSNADTVDHLKEVIEGRLQALAGVHNLLVEGPIGVGADLHELVTQQLAPLARKDRVEIEGAPLTVGPRFAQSLAVAVHELTTNATKYGALGREKGRVLVDWKSDADGGIVFRWRETGCEGVRPPTHHGFGTVVVERMIRSLGGVVKCEWHDAGLECEILLPQSAIAEKMSPI